MRLKSLTIQGFKSFADKACLEFEPGLTGIVGPNGCGKSNVVDAIRWVMGEQSPRSLRGSEMMDVVFGGTQRRAPSGVAKVQMLLVPDEADLGVAEARGWASLVSPDQEIEITRKLSRSGESQYFLNRSRCRLRDITELLLEARLASRDYSVIEQGKIDRILSLRPSERLQVFEEAAGVRRFHLQRERTELKLTQTLENLDRVADIHAEVERQCAQLEMQASAARRYLEAGALLDQARTCLYRLRSGRLEAARAESQAELEALAAAEAGLNAALADVQASLAQGEASLRLQQKARSGLESELRAADTSLRTLATEQELLQGIEPQLQERIALAQEGTQALDRRARELDQELLAASEEEVFLAEKLDCSSGDLATAQSEVQRRRQQVEVLEAGAARSRQDYVALHSRHASAFGERRRLEETVEKEDRIQQRLAKSLQDTLDEERRLVGTRSGLGNRASTLAEENAAFEELLSRLEERRTSAAARVRRGQEELHGLEKRIEGVAGRSRTLEELLRSLEGVGDGAQAVLNWARARGERPSLLLQSLDLPPELEPAITAALGDCLEAVVAPSLHWALEAIDAVGEALSPTSFLVRDLLPQVVEPGELPSDTLLRLLRWLPGSDPRLASALAAYRFAEDREAALQRLPKLDPGQILVTGQGETFAAGGMVSAGMQKSRAGQSLRRTREARRLRDQLRTSEAERVQLAAELRAAESELERTAAELSEIQPRRRDAEAGRSRLGVEIDKLELRLERTFLDRASVEQQLASLTTNLAAGRYQLQGLAAQSLQLERAIAEAEASERRAEVELSQARLRLKAFEEDEILLLRLEARTLGERLRAVNARAADLQKRAAETQAERGLRAKEALDAGRRLEEVHRRLGELAASAASLSARRLPILDALDSASAACQSAAQGVSKRRETVEQIHCQKQELLEAQGQVRLRIAECRFALESLGELRAGLPDPLPEDLGGAGKLRTEAELEEAIAGLERKQKGLGNLNFAAVEEFESCSHRLGLLSAQKSDLERSVADLRTAIVQLSERASGLFVEAFEAIRDNFRRLFAQVLAGGSADLLLLQGPDAPGVEIRAQPPGKKLRSLELLSGGEKALVTILLLVSIFLFRPSTFCILDEVDAPLDDVNNRRFSELMHTIALGSQVLVVTHSKRTIEACDRLYGVTMDEPGVSKLVSVRLHERKAG